MLDDEFKKQRAQIVRDLAEKADPFIKECLLDLAARYEDNGRLSNVTKTPNDLQFGSHNNGGSER
ncbi:hypothetical protein V1290_005286 [Bradyrhizobium sp. AZCC 1578]|uniref:hypothetical protein n=1 Tax=unclassified Bradyrhizobium TaxID=2631580 RepID=UPI002FF16E01